MTNPESEKNDEQTEGIDDEQLPEDLQATDDNPLAQPLSEDEVDVDDLDMGGGKKPDQWDDEDLED